MVIKLPQVATFRAYLWSDGIKIAICHFTSDAAVIKPPPSGFTIDVAVTRLPPEGLTSDDKAATSGHLQGLPPM